jgi:hypothetical protein
MYNGQRYMAREGDLLRVSNDGALTRVRMPGMYAGPVALASAGPWLWMVWSGDTSSAIGRYRASDNTLEVLGRGINVMTARLAADGARGDVALLVDGSRVRRVVTDAAPAVLGFAEGVVVTEPTLALWVEPPVPSAVRTVEFRLDGMRVEQVMSAPYTWGTNGYSRMFPSLSFGEHTVEVVVTYNGADEFRATRRFQYLSPLGRVPTYTADIAPLYQASCSRCHSSGIARDLRGYTRISDQAPIVAASVQSRRMPPDVALDTQSVRLITAWVAGGAPE